MGATAGMAGCVEMPKVGTDIEAEVVGVAVGADRPFGVGRLSVADDVSVGPEVTLPTVGSGARGVGLGDMAIEGLGVMVVEDGVGVCVSGLGAFVCGTDVAVGEVDEVGEFDIDVAVVDGFKVSKHVALVKLPSFTSA